MPGNPFDPGSNGNLDREAQGLRSLAESRRRLSASIGDQTRSVRSLADAQRAAGETAASNQKLYSSSAEEAVRQLRAQGDELSSLDSTRARFHDAEMSRAEGLLKTYEKIKKTLKEIGEDSDDTGTVLGSMLQDVHQGYESFQRYGEVATENTRVIGDLNLSFDDLRGSVVRTAVASVNLAHNMHEGVSSVSSYAHAAQDLRVGLAKVTMDLGLQAGTAQKTASALVKIANIDISNPGAAKGVADITRQLETLRLRGVDVQTAMAAMDEQSRRTGVSYEQSASDVSTLTTQSLQLKNSLSSTKNVLQGFAGVIRDGFVRAVAEATRGLDSQILSMKDAGAMYAVLTQKAAAYGLSTKGANKVATALGRSLTSEHKDTTVGFMAGQHESARLNSELNRRAKAKGFKSFSDIHDERLKKQISEGAFSSMGVSINAGTQSTRDLIMRLRNKGGLSNVDIDNLLSGTEAGITGRIGAVRELAGKVKDPAVRRRLTNQMLGTTGLTTLQRDTIDTMVQGGSKASDIGKMIKKFKDDAEKAEKAAKKNRDEAVATINHMRHPIDTLFAIKDYLKSILLSTVNLSGYVGKIMGFLTGETPSTGSQVDNMVSSDEGVVASNNALEAAKKASGEASVEYGRVLSNPESTEEQRKKARDKLKKATDHQAAAISQATLDRTRAIHEAQEATGVTVNGEPAPEGPSMTQRAAQLGQHAESAIIRSTLGDRAANTFDDLSSSLTHFFSGGGGNQSEEGRQAGVNQLAQQNQEAHAAATGSSTAATPGTHAPANSSAQPALPSTAPGEGEAEGAGLANVEVDSTGQASLAFRVKINNLGDAVAYHNSQQTGTNRLNGSS